ncbi:MAG: hypothetical protein EOO18_01340 [Chryseobacterium sp.]|nr:MAG: hypothetical protein EOO18_01340 [Chryseobacterium sp.]
MWTKYFWLVPICFLTLACHWKEAEKFTDKNEKRTKDTISLLNLVKSYEPKKFRGKVPQQFYDNRGAFDFWRYPLVYPYSIGCIDVRDYGSIYSDKDKTNYDEGGSIQPLTDYFDKFTFDKVHFVATKCRSPFDRDTVEISDQYFVFSFANGTSKNIKGLGNLKKELKNMKFSGDTTFMTIREYGQKL